MGHSKLQTPSAVGIVLCGGHSRRMGFPKAALPVGSETMLARVVRQLAIATQTVIVVAARNQELPQLPANVSIVYDQQPDCGPLAGIQAGLAAASDREIAFVTGCDAPLLVPSFVARMLELVDGFDAAVPVAGELHHTAAAAYRCTTVLAQATRLLQNQERKFASLLGQIRTRRVPTETLRDVDPELATLKNVNKPQDYLDILRTLGFTPTPSILEALGVDGRGS